MGGRWRQYKSLITTKLREANKKSGKKRAFKLIKPKNITNDEEWQNFIKYRTSSAFESRSKRFRDIRLGQQIRHTTGRRGYARLQEIMKKEANDKGKHSESITRVDVWIRGHKRKEGNPISESLQNVLNEIEELRSSECPPNDSCIKEDAIAKVLGTEKRGQVRGLGFGATPSRVDAQIQSRENVKLLEAKLKVTNDELSSLRETVAGIMKQNEELHNRIAMEDAIDDDVGDQVAVEGRIASTDPKATLHHMPLGKGYWKVWVDVVYEDINLCRPTDKHGTLNQAIGSTVAWIKDCIKLL
ncbi:hypothetical protein EZV62_001655 [Acer yangbiense]|uniref:DUF8039 domain-containing protein n=1 Tax=Acer yangbiense TaxID=1000413 RepID=A0A5C7IX39_9ROSI|nr:hypothetical protein EZV62_001655 [Acer yangbiense]